MNHLTASLQDLVRRMYVHGPSTRGVQVVMQDLLEDTGIARSVVIQAPTERLPEDFEKFRRRPLGEEGIWHIFLDGTYMKYHLESERT